MQHYSFPDPNKQQSKLCQHSQILLYKNDHILPWDEWLPVTESAFDLAADLPSTSQQASAAAITSQVLQILQQHNICTNARQHGIEASYVAAYVNIRQQRISSSSNSIPSSSGEDVKPSVPKLPADEAEVHFHYEPAQQPAAAPILIIQQHRLSMAADPIPDAESQQQRYVAIARLPLHQWLYYEYDTGVFCS